MKTVSLRLYVGFLERIESSASIFMFSISGNLIDLAHLEVESNAAKISEVRTAFVVRKNSFILFQIMFTKAEYDSMEISESFLISHSLLVSSDLARI